MVGDYDDMGNNVWRADSASPSCRVVEKVPRTEVGKVIDELMLRAPKLRPR